MFYCHWKTAPNVHMELYLSFILDEVSKRKTISICSGPLQIFTHLKLVASKI